MTDINILKGDQVGGCITMISTNMAKIVIDYGEDLPGFESCEQVSIDWERENVDAVFFTHYHADHIGRFMEIPENIQLYMGECTRRVLINHYRALRMEDYVRRLSSDKGIHIIEGNNTVNIKDIRLTPYGVDHSAFDSYMFFIETPDKNILHTGDYRDHGLKGHKRVNGTVVNSMLYTIENDIKLNGKRQIDILITEGTLVGTDLDKPRYTEEDMQNELIELFRDQRYVFVKISSTNADSLLSFYRAARINGMGFYGAPRVLEQLKLFEEMSEKTDYPYVYTPSWPIFHKNDYDNVCEKYKRAFRAQRKHMRKEGFVVIVSEYDEDLFDEFSDLDPMLIYSMWEGYIEEEIGGEAYNEQLASFCKRHNAVQIHTGGHASPEFISEVIKCSCPTEAIIPIHTFNTKDFVELDITEELKDIVITNKDQERVEKTMIIVC